MINCKSKYIILLVTLILININVFSQNTNNPLNAVDISKLNKISVIVKPYNKSIIIAYKTNGIKFKSVTNEEYEIIEYAYFLLKNKNQYEIIGKIDLSGIYNKNNILIFKPKNGNNYIGISSDLLTYPTSPSYVEYSKNTYIICNTAVPLAIDFIDMNLLLFDYEL